MHYDNLSTLDNLCERASVVHGMEIHETKLHETVDMYRETIANLVVPRVTIYQMRHYFTQKKIRQL